jgi:hypothetical protein
MTQLARAEKICCTPLIKLFPMLASREKQDPIV